MKPLDSKLRVIIKNSFKESTRLGGNKIEPEHLLLSLLEDGKNEAIEVLLSMGSDIEDLSSKVEAYVRLKTKNPSLKKKLLTFSNSSKIILNSAELESDKLGDNDVNCVHLLLSLLKNRTLDCTKVLFLQGITYKTIKSTLIEIKKETNMSGIADDYSEKSEGKSKPGGKSNTPILDNFGRDLTKMAEEGKLDPVIGREDEIERVAQILSRRKKNNPILIGSPGAGKSIIIDGLALKIVEKKCPRTLFDMRIVALDMALLVAGTKYRGQFEERLKGIMDELEKTDNVIIFIDEIHTMIGAGNASGSLDASNILKPALARGEIQCIGATTLDEYRENFEKDGALTRRFQEVMIDPTSTEDTITILNNIKDKYESHHRVVYDDDAIIACVKMSDRYITDRVQPDKSIDILDEVGARAQVRVEAPENIISLEKAVVDIEEKKKQVIKSQRYEEAANLRDEERQLRSDLESATSEWKRSLNETRKVITEEDVASVVAKITGIPVSKVGESDLVKLKNMSSELSSKVIGQDHVIEQVSKAIRRNRMGIKKHNKPQASFIFLGSTGGGKSLMAKSLAKIVFGTEDSMIRIDMSEYMEKHSVSKLIGAPPGYVGHEDGGQLTERVRRKPYSLILFDEIEKAHPDIFNILLQVLDEGHLTDGLGRKVDFKNTLIIMTSNVGARKLQDFGSGVGFGTKAKIENLEDIRNSVIEESVKKTFSPEFLNRLDDVIIFKTLGLPEIKRIVDIPVTEFKERMLELGYKVEVTEKMKDFLVEKGYDEKYGARPLNRAIQKYLEDPVAEKMMDGDASEGDSIKIDYKTDVVVTVKKPKKTKTV